MKAQYLLNMLCDKGTSNNFEDEIKTHAANHLVSQWEDAYISIGKPQRSATITRLGGIEIEQADYFDSVANYDR